MSRRLGILSLVLTLAMAGSAVAQQHATLLLNSGERVSGDLVDLGGVGFTINVNGTERRIPAGEVVGHRLRRRRAQLSGDELNRIGNGQAVVLTNGDVVQGRLDDIGGTAPLRLTVNLSSGGSHDYTSNEVRRVYLSKPAAATGSHAAGRRPSGSRHSGARESALGRYRYHRAAGTAGDVHGLG